MTVQAKNRIPTAFQTLFWITLEMEKEAKWNMQGDPLGRDRMQTLLFSD